MLRFRNVIYLVLCVLLLFVASVPSLGEAAMEKKVVRVGWYESPFNYFDRYGNRTGYAYEYQKKIAAYTGWEYEYVKGSWAELFEKLKRGEIDLMSEISYTEERSKQMLFSEHTMGTEEYAIYVASDNTKIKPNDILTLNGRAVSVDLGSVQEFMFREWCAKNNIHVKSVASTADENAKMKMLQNGELDAYVGPTSFAKEGACNQIAVIGGSDYYFAINKDRADLKQELDLALNHIQSSNRYYNRYLNDKYFGKSGMSAFLAPEELEWIKKHGVIRVGYLDNYLPYSDKDDKTGQATGFIRDFENMSAAVIKNADIRYEMRAFASNAEMEAALKSGKIDCIFPACMTIGEADNNGMQITDAFLSTALFVAYNPSKRPNFKISGIEKIAANSEDFDVEIIKNAFPDCIILSYGSNEEVLKAIANGDADCIVIGNYRINACKEILAEYNMIPVATGRDVRFSYAVLAKDQELYAILERIIALLNDTEINSSLASHSVINKQVSFSDFVKDNLSLVFILLAGIAAISFLAVKSIHAEKNARKLNQKLEEQLGEITSLNSELEENQARLEETAAENETQIEEITRLNESITTQYEMINAAGRVYNCIYYIDLQDCSYIEVSSKLSKFAKVGEYIAAKGNAEESLEMFLKHLILPEYEAKLREFCDLSTLDERLLGKIFITCDYEGVVNGYSQGVFIAGDRDEKGKLRHVFWAVRDNNEIKNRELAYAKELEKALDAAEAANQAKTVFLNNMSHDIRTPMNAILGFAKLMEKELDKPEVAREHLKKIHYSGEYLLTIINNILDMARIESGRTTVDEELIDLAEAQGGVVAVFEEAAKKKNISLNCSWDIQHRYVYVDYAKCQQVAVNLISNAIKYTPNGGSVTVRVDELPSERQGYTDLCLTVQDTGIGMSKEFQEELFEAFSRERNTTHSKVVGTGLGMAIVKKLVNLMQGTVFVDSEPGKGSTFKVRVSLRIAEAPKMYISRQEEAAPLAIGLSGKRILLAEDNELNAEIATCILEDEGFIVEHAEDGVACVDMVNKKAVGYYDVILMDIQMPNLNGYGATEKIRKFADKAKATIPIIAMTANAFDEDKKRALDAGMDGFCTKPIDIEQLNKELVRVLG